ncbi:DUF551 domain-containing protein [Klebsiella variicola]|uniref:DUF551 domain-containing protein n=1 Tax=Klebsiella variicola TaxID=244366 RepID=UPI003B9F44AB
MTKSAITRERVVALIAEHSYDSALVDALEHLLAAMDSEPVAWTWHYREQWHVTSDKGRAAFVATDGDVAVLPLYRHAQPVPVVSTDLLHAAASAIEDLLTTKDRTGAGVWFDLPFRLRSAANAQPAPVVLDGYVMVPKEATLEMIKSGASAASNGMLIPGIYKAMLAAADCSIPMISDRWIPVSEQMPEVGDIVLTAMGGAVNVGEMECSAANCRFFTSVISGRELPATHWMPLPAGPKEDINALIPLVSRNEQEGK